MAKKEYTPKKAPNGQTLLRAWWEKIVESNFSAIFEAFSQHILGQGDRHLTSEIDVAENGKTLDAALAEKAELSNVLAKDNAEEYTPESDYNPATKKYVDDKAASSGSGDVEGIATNERLIANSNGGAAMGSGSAVGSGFAGGNMASAQKGAGVGQAARANGDGIAGGEDTQAENGAALGKKAKETGGGLAGGEQAETYGGLAGGYTAKSQRGFAGGWEAQAGDGVAAGYSARCQDERGTAIDAIQLGTGTNNTEKTLQVYDYTLMNADGTIPPERLPGGASSELAPEMHRVTFRGKNLGDTFTEAQKEAIKNGTFDDLYLGDYWEVETTNIKVAGGVHRFRIVDIDYWYNLNAERDTLVTDGKTPTNKHHLVIMPDAPTSYELEPPFSDTEEILSPIFGDEYILSYKEYFVNKFDENGIPTGSITREATIELPTERMIYGAEILAVVGDRSVVANYSTTQLALFSIAPKFIIAADGSSAATPTANYWLRDSGGIDVSGQIRQSVYVGSYGNPMRIDYYRSDFAGVRPVFGVTGGE